VNAIRVSAEADTVMAAALKQVKLLCNILSVYVCATCPTEHVLSSAV